MWGYYGSKSKIINKYPKPINGKIIEPFGGTAQYSLKYWESDVLLIDKYEIIIKLWKWIQGCTEKDILGIRRLKYGESTDDFDWSCDEEKWLVGFIIAGAPVSPRKKATRWKTVLRPNTQNYKLQLIASSLHKIRHWKILNCDYKSIQNEKATWFIDPPYVEGGEHYPYGNKYIDYYDLGKWCKERTGQVIACEKTGADWLPFVHLCSSRGNLRQHEEAIWTNE